MIDPSTSGEAVVGEPSEANGSGLPILEKQRRQSGNALPKKGMLALALNVARRREGNPLSFGDARRHWWL